MLHISSGCFQTNAKLEAELVHLREELAEARGLREAAERERQETVRLLQEALRRAAACEREPAVEDEVVAGSPRLAQENSDKEIVEHKTENGCEVAPNGRLVNGSEKSATCESNGLENDGSVSKCVAIAEKQDLVEREALVSPSQILADTMIWTEEPLKITGPPFFFCQLIFPWLR